MEYVQEAAKALSVLVKQGVALTGLSETQLVQLAAAAVVAIGLLYLLKDVISTLLIPSIKVDLTEGEHAGACVQPITPPIMDRRLFHPRSRIS